MLVISNYSIDASKNENVKTVQELNHLQILIFYLSSLPIGLKNKKSRDKLASKSTLTKKISSLQFFMVSILITP